jgi:hypothetical protein
MINWRLSDDPVDEARPGEADLPKAERANIRCKVSAISHIPHALGTVYADIVGVGGRTGRSSCRTHRTSCRLAHVRTSDTSCRCVNRC